MFYDIQIEFYVVDDIPSVPVSADITPWLPLIIIGSILATLLIILLLTSCYMAIFPPKKTNEESITNPTAPTLDSMNIELSSTESSIK